LQVRIERVRALAELAVSETDLERAAGTLVVVVLFIVFGVCLTAAALFLNVSWVIVNWRATLRK
jgi:hypothetical protein